MNLDKNSTNKNLYMDAGNQLLKIGYQVDDVWIIKKIPNQTLDDVTLSEVLSTFSFHQVYWGSVCANSSSMLTKYFSDHDIKHVQITPQTFRNHLLLNDAVDLNEVGVDILGFCFYIKHEPHCLGISFGTATVVMEYNMQLDGVVIGPDFVNSYKFLDDILGINANHIIMHDDFGHNTMDAINGSKYFMLNGFVNQMLLNRDIQKIFVSGGNKQIFNIYKNIYNKEIVLIDEIVLKGYQKLIESIK